jgi:hypothetical protein
MSNHRFCFVHHDTGPGILYYQDVDDVLDPIYMPNTSEDIDVNDLLDLSYVPNTADDIVLTQALAPAMMVTPGGHTRGNTPFPPRVQDLVLEFKKASTDLFLASALAWHFLPLALRF